MEYPRFIDENFTPFNPVELAGATKNLVCRKGARKYTGFYCTGVYGGISTGYLVGCNLRCIFCWVQLSREYPERFGELFSPEQVVRNLVGNARRAGVRKTRISGGEPTLCREHLLKVLDLISETDLSFVLETNGILLGHDPDYAAALAKYKNLYVRISIKAGTADGFQRRTGGLGEFYELPFRAVEHARKNDLFFRVACMSDPRVMPSDERRAMMEKLTAAGYTEGLEEESCDPYDTTLVRLAKAGWKPLKG